MFRRTKIAATIVAMATATALVGPAAVAAPQPPRPVGYVDQFMSGTPSPLAAFNWKQRAIDYDSFAYNWNQPGAHRTIYADTTHNNMTTDSYKMPSYYGDLRIDGTTATDGNQEALGQLASVVGASLVGVNKANQGGYNYVDMSRTFFHPSLGIALNGSRPDVNGGADSWWYTTLANSLYMMLGDQYPTSNNMTTIQTSIADKYYAAVVALGGANANFDGQGFNFNTMTRYAGVRNEGGDGATGTAAILLWAYSRFGDPKYLQGAKWSLDYLERSNGRLYYEILPVLAPYLAARMNAQFGTNYDVGRLFNGILDVNPVRPTWGSMRGQWGGYDVGGLQGQIIDNYGPGSGGYGFAMNTFAASFLAPTVKYDTRFANSVGKYMLHMSNASRFYYPDQLPAANQGDGSRWINAPEKVLAYEGLREEFNGTRPMATSDVTRFGYGGGDSDLGLYGSAWVGFLGATVADTNVANVRRVDLNALDFYGDKGLPRYLYYNPNNVAASIQVTVPTASSVYDAVSDTLLSSSVTGTTTIVVPPGSSRVIVLGAANGSLTRSGGKTFINGATVSYRSGAPDLAYGQPVTASSTTNGNVAANLTDGTTARRWESQTADPQWVTVELPNTSTVNRVVMRWEVASAKAFNVQVSPDNATWTNVYTTTNGPGGTQTVTFNPVTAKFLRVLMTQRNTGWAYSMFDLEVYNDNLAASAPTSASSTTNGNLSSYLTDANLSTRWESQTTDPQSVTIDLGSQQTVGRVVTRWEVASAKSYQIRVSPDNVNWTTVYTTTAGAGGIQNNAFTPVSGRYVKVDMTQRNTVYAYSIYDLEVYGQ